MFDNVKVATYLVEHYPGIQLSLHILWRKIVDE
jgi:hypothetical protein